MQRLDIQRLFDIHTTVLQMVRDRGYDISDRSHLLGATFAEFNTAVENFMQEGTTKKTNPYHFLSYRFFSSDEPKRVMLVYYGGTSSKSSKKISVETANIFVNECVKTGATEALFIVNLGLSNKANSKLEDEPGTRIQVFQESDLTYNPTLHVDVPRQELLSNEEANKVIASIKGGPSKLLLMRSSDPIVRYYGWPNGGLVKIYRDDFGISILSDKSINYRLIVA